MRVVGRFFPPVAEALPLDPKLILIFSTTGIGDSLFDTAAIHSLKTAYPAARIIVCAHHKRGTIACHHPDVEEVVSYGKSPFYFWKLLTRFRRERSDLIILLNVNEEVVPLAYFLNRRALVGGIKRCERFAYLLSHGVCIPEEGHILRRSLVIAESVGGARNITQMNYTPTDKERRLVAERFDEWINQPFIIFQTGGGKTLAWRNWPTDAYIRTIRWLEAVSDVKVVLTGGWDNEETARAIQEACPRVINLCSKTTLEETAALLSHAALLVSTDTGVMHLGLAVGCPTLCILHYRSPSSLVGPLDQSSGHEIVEIANPAHDATPLEGAMHGISDEAVQAALLRMIRRQKLPLDRSMSSPPVIEIKHA